MKVKNDFPNVDKVLRRLKEFKIFIDKKKKTTDDDFDIDCCNDGLSNLTQFIDNIERYLDSACNADMRIQRTREQTKDDEKIKQTVQDEDDLRTSYHSGIITNMVMIDKLADYFELPRVFDYAEEFHTCFHKLTVHTKEEKANLTERERIKRREMGNFGLYIAAAVTAGVSREATEITDDDLREFADCEGDTVKVDTNIFNKVKSNSHSLKRNVNIMLDDDNNLPGFKFPHFLERKI